jgi:UDP-2,3-diacylglucosamine pyrophosphatase LpxH
MNDVIVISDLHLGRKDSNVAELLEIIKETQSKTLILNGDIFDQFAYFKDRGKLYREEHRKYVKEIRGILKLRKTKLIYLVGNHDYLAFLFVPFGFLFGMKIRKRTRVNDIIIEHGDWITFYLRLRGIERSNDYHENCIRFAKTKNKKLVVGHSHHPEKLINNDWVYDEGDWVENNTYLTINGGMVELVDTLDLKSSGQ